MNEVELMRQAKEAIQQGDKVTGRKLLSQVVVANPQNEIAWLWLSSTISDPRKKEYCLERVLKINPNNEVARKHWLKLQAAELRAETTTCASPPMGEYTSTREPKLETRTPDQKQEITARSGSVVKNVTQTIQNIYRSLSLPQQVVALVISAIIVCMLFSMVFLVMKNLPMQLFSSFSSSPRTTMERFFKAIDERDTSTVDKMSSREANNMFSYTISKQANTRPCSYPTFIDDEKSGNTAWITVQCSGETKLRVYTLVHEDGSWKVHDVDWR